MDIFITICSIFGLLAILIILYFLIFNDFKLIYVKLFVRSTIRTAVITEYRIYFKSSFFHDLMYDIEKKTWLIGNTENSEEYWIDYFKNVKKTTYAEILTEKDFVRANIIVKKYLDN